MITKESRIVVLMGGPSREAEVSRNTGKAILEALTSIGYQAISMEYDPHHVVEQLKEAKADAVFIALAPSRAYSSSPASRTRAPA